MSQYWFRVLWTIGLSLCSLNCLAQDNAFRKAPRIDRNTSLQ